MNDKATDTRPAFFMVEDIVIEKFGLSPYEGWVYVTIIKYANRKTGEAFPGIATLAKVTQMSKSQVMRSIATLEKKCLIRVVRDDKPFEGEKRKREVNHYFVLSASNGVSQEVGVVSDRKYPSVSQEVGVVSDRDLNQYSSEPELINNSDANASGAMDTTKKDRSNPNFDAVCEYVFKTNPKDVGGDGGRIGAIAAWLNGKSDGMKRAGGKVGFISKPAEPKHIQLFARYWTQKYPNATIPHDFVKFVEAWRAWASTKKEVVIPSDPSMDLNTPQPITPILMQQQELT